MPDYQLIPVEHDPFQGDGAELRAYEPTWRDRMASFLLPENAGYYPRRMARELIGSSGIGATGLSAVDFVPGVGPALNAQEAIQRGDIPDAAGNIAAAVVPGAALAGRAMMPAARPLIRAAIGAGAGAAAGTGAAIGLQEAAAAPRGVETLTPAEREVYRRLGPDDRAKFWTTRAANDARAQSARDAAAATEAARNAQAERELRGQAERAELERQQRLQAEADRVAEEKRVAGLPFRERYPIPAAAIQAIFTAGGSAIPYGIGRASNIARNLDTKAWELLTNRASKAIEAGNLPKARIAANELTSRLEGATQPAQSSIGGRLARAAGLANSAFMPLEGGTVIPNAWDYYTHPAGDPAHEHAVEELTNRLPFNFGVSMAEGFPISILGYKLAGLTNPVKAPPIARSQGLVQSYEQAFPESARMSLPLPPAPPARRRRTSKTTASQAAQSE